MGTEIVELLVFCLGASLEIILTVIWPLQSHVPEEKTVSLYEYSELVAYEEIEHENPLIDAPHFRRSVRSMHHYVPLNLFKATVRVSKFSSPSDEVDALVEADSALQIDGVHLDSPASFPPTPFSRSYVMHRHTEKVMNLMIGARDRLRLEAQSVSRDAYSRMAASEAKSRGQFAVFDPSATAGGIALVVGNHGAVKVGNGSCSSCRSMIAIHPNTYVYYEFSITVKESQIPMYGIGLATAETPSNIMVGSNPDSIGLYYDGQILIGSHWYQTPIKEVGATTIGVLVYIPKETNLLLNAPIEQEVTQPEHTISREGLESTPESETSEDAIPAVDSPQKFFVRFNIYGEPVPQSSELTSQIENMKLGESPLFPTVSLLSEDTRVWCRFSEVEICSRTRQNIQAPPNCRVYCVDGSLLLDETQ